MPPEVDGSEASTDLLKNLYPESEPGKEMILPEEATELIEQREVLKGQAKELDAQISECENKLKDLLKKNEIGLCGDKKVTWKTYSKSTIDSKQLKAENPDVYEKYLKTSSYRKFDIK